MLEAAADADVDAVAAALAMLAAWAPVEFRGLPLASSRATSGGAANAAAMLKMGRVAAGGVAVAAGGLEGVGLPPPPETAHEPTMVQLLRGAVDGGAEGSPVPTAW